MADMLSHATLRSCRTSIWPAACMQHFHSPLRKEVTTVVRAAMQSKVQSYINWDRSLLSDICWYPHPPPPHVGPVHSHASNQTVKFLLWSLECFLLSRFTDILVCFKTMQFCYRATRGRSGHFTSLTVGREHSVRATWRHHEEQAIQLQVQW
jgi:hypothetical protein